MKLIRAALAVCLLSAFCTPGDGESPDVVAAANIRKRVAQVRSDFRTLSLAIELYFVDHKAYPACTTDPVHLLRPPSQADAVAEGISVPIPSFHAPGFPHGPASLTTPVAYLRSLPADPFVEQPGLTYGYFSLPKGWIVWSAGPDSIFDLDWTTYDPDKPQPQPEMLARYAYDPTNGTMSPGDIFRVKE